MKYLLAIISLGWLFWTNVVVAEPFYIQDQTLDYQIRYYALQYHVSESLSRKIMTCESGLKPDAINYNGGKSKDYSYWQISDKFWQKPMSELGLDIADPNQNLAAGFYILSKYGTQPWYLSKHCWNN